MRIGIVSQYFEPEPGPARLPAILAHGLARRGHEVRVVTGFPNYPSGQVMPGYRMSRRMDEMVGDLRVRRVGLYPSHDRSALRRAATYGSFALSSLASGVNALQGMDAIWVANSPITVSLPMWFLRHVRKAPVVLHLFDLWPDNVAASGFLGSGRTSKVADQILGGWCRAMYRSANRVAYISPSVSDLLVHRGVPENKLVYIPLWADEDAVHRDSPDLRSDLGIGGETVVLVYAGSLGRAQGVDVLVDACAMVDDPHFACLVAGTGVAEAELRGRAHAVGATNVRFLGQVPREGLPALMATGDLHFVSLRPTTMATYSMPSKVQATLASSKAMLVAADGDVADVARASGAGFVVQNRDPRSVADAIRAAIRLGRGQLRDRGRRGRSFYDRMFSVDVGVRRVEAALTEVKEADEPPKTWQVRRKHARVRI